jgi:hypothetical protein
MLITAGVRAVTLEEIKGDEESNITAVEESAAPLKQVEVSSFSVMPRTITQNQMVDFVLEVKNTGNMATTIEPEIDIYSGTSPVEKVNFAPLVLAAGHNVSLLRSYLVTLDVGEYRVVAKVYYDNRSSYASEVGTLSVVAERERVEGGLKNETPHLRFWLFPVLIEGKPGDASAVSFELENPSSEEVSDLKLSIEGIPRGWVTLKPEELTLGGNESAGVNIAISVPRSALPGDHRAVLRVKSTKEEAIASFIFRIRPYPPGFEKPTVLRKVYLDEKEGRALVSLEVGNSGTEVEGIEILEEIPKEIATRVEDINFKIPVAVLEADPLVAWRLNEVDPYEVYTLEYEVGSIAARYSPYIYWPLRQVNVFYTSVSGIELLQFSGALAAYAVPGKESEVKLRITNPTLEAMNITLRLVAPPGWEVSPQEITRLLFPGYAQEMVFTVKPPREASPGSYTLIATVAGENGEVSQPLTLVLQQEKKKLNLKKFLIPVASLVAVILLVYAAIFIYRKKRVYRREVVEAVGRIKSSMEEE